MFRSFTPGRSRLIGSAIATGVFVALGVSGSAAAATLTVTPDKASYAVGETITLTVHGDDQGASAFSVFGRLTYNAALTQTTSASQTQLQGATGPWILGTLSTGDGFAEAFNQITFPNPDTAVNLPGVLSTVKLVAEAPGHVTVAWDTSPEFGLDFFGLTSAPGAEIDIVAAPQPLCAGLVPTTGSLVGTPGNDVLVGTAGADDINGLGGNDVICAGGGDDEVSGGGGDDRIQGDGGSDEIAGGSGADRLFGGDGADSLFGGTGADRLFGEAGDDLASGDSGNDALSGAAGNDVLLGGTENDSLSGATGTDHCEGSLGTDTASLCESVVGVP